MDRCFVVDGINDNICRLEDIDTKEILEVYNFILPDIKEGDILKLENGIFRRDEDYRENREESLMKKFLEVQGIGDNSD